MNTVAFFNNKGGVGKTTLVYHVAWMLSGMGRSVLAVDLDPQANLTSMCLPEEELEDIWPETGDNKSVLACVKPAWKVWAISQAHLFGEYSRIFI